MAKIGLNNFRYGILTENANGTHSYDGAKSPGKAISCNVSVNTNDASLYADDVLQESDAAFSNGDVTIGVDRDDPATAGEMLGHTVTQGRMVRNANDVAPYIGFGRIIVVMVDNVRKYKVEFLYKVKMGEPSQEDETKGENLDFRTYEMAGKVATLANGDWSETQTFDTHAEALTYLESLLGASGG